MRGFRRSALRPLILAALSLALRAADLPEIFAPIGHGSSIMVAACSPDGRYAVTGAMDNKLILWDLHQGREVRTYAGHSDYIQALAISPDGRRIVSASHDATVRVWNLQTGLELRRYDDLRVNSFAFEAGGGVLAGDFIGGALRLEPDLGTRTVLKQPDFKGEVRGLALLPDGHLLTGGKGGFRVSDVRTGKTVRSFAEKMVGTYADALVAISPDRRLAVLGHEGRLQVWDVATGEPQAEFTPPEQTLNDIAFTPDGRHLVAACGDATLRVWEVASRQQTRSIYWYRTSTEFGGRYGVKCLALTPDGLQVLGCYAGGRLRLWNLVGGELVAGTLAEDSPAWKAGLREGDDLLAIDDRPLTGWADLRARILAAPGKALSVRYRRDGLEATVLLTPATAQGKDAQGRPVPVGVAGIPAGATLVAALGGLKDGIGSAGLSPDGRYVVASHDSGRQVLWDLQAGTLVRQARPHGPASMAFLPRGKGYLSAGGGQVTRWDPDRADPLATLAEDYLGTTEHCLAVAPDGRKALTGAEGRLTLIDLERWREVRTLLLPADYVKTIYSLAIAPDSRLAASGDGKRMIRLWDLDSGRAGAVMEADSWVYALDFSPDGRRLMAGSNLYVAMGIPHKTLQMWDVRSGRVLAEFGGYSQSVRAVKFSADGRRLLTGGDDLILWDAASGTRLRTLEGHRDTVYAVAFLKDGRRALSAGMDGTVRLWDLDSGRETAQFILFQDGEWAAVTPEGFFSGSAGGARHLSVRIGLNVYGIDQFYNRFYRPERVRLALAGQALPGGDSLLQVLARKPAPAVKLLAPAAGAVEADAVTVSVEVADQGGGIGAVNLYLNGAQVANEARGLAVKPGDSPVRRLSFQVPLLAGVNDLKVVALNQEGSMESDPTQVRVVSKAAVAKPVLHALVVGINQYRNQAISLTYAVADAQAVAAALRRCAGPLFDRISVKELTTPEATTKEAILAAFQALRGEMRPNDLFVFYNASHGVVDTVDDQEQYFLLPSNILLLSSRRLGTDALGQKELAQVLGSLPAQKKLVILDTCNAGRGGKEIQAALLQQTRGLTEATAIKLLQRAVGSAVFSASSDAQAALEGYQGHGLFTWVLLQGLAGQADLKKDGFITVLGLADYLEEQVTRLSETVFKRQQTPVIQTGVNFPIGRVVP